MDECVYVRVCVCLCKAFVICIPVGDNNVHFVHSRQGILAFMMYYHVFASVCVCVCVCVPGYVCVYI